MKIAVIGAYGVGRSYRVERFPRAGETVVAVTSSDSHGGKGSNQAVAAARLGADVALFSAIGTDVAGASARSLWAQEGIDASSVVEFGEPTMTGVIAVEPSGENRIIIAPGALARLTPSHVDGFTASIAAADLLVVSVEVPAQVALRGVQIAREQGVPIVLNPAPAGALSGADLREVDVLTPNASEAQLLTGLTDPASAGELLSRWTGGAVVVTLGGDGVVVAESGRSRLMPSRPVADVVDTTGAGDSFTAALAVALGHGLDVAAAASWAMAAGAYTVQIRDVVPALPRIDQLPPIADRDHARFREDTL